MSKTVFITGGASGIGAAAVTKFRDEGWNVLFTDIHEPSCKPEGTCFVKADSRNKAEPASFVYGMTKGAIGQITRNLAIDLGPMGIRVNAVCAGTIHTALVDNLFIDFAKREGKTLDDYWKQENSLYARGEAGRPEEVAELVFFLASDKASFCTGGHYLCDGGLVCR